MNGCRPEELENSSKTKKRAFTEANASNETKAITQPLKGTLRCFSHLQDVAESFGNTEGKSKSDIFPILPVFNHNGELKYDDCELFKF